MNQREYARFADIREVVTAVTDADSQENYATLEDAQDAILSEVEDRIELTPAEASDVNDLVCDWWDEVDHGDE